MTSSEPPTPAPDCWLHPAVEVRSSPIEGLGLFATAPIARGEVVSRLGGRLVTTRELHAVVERSDQYVDSITVAEDVQLLLPPGRPNGYGNHSCDPNLWWEGFFELIARRDIATDEELSNDYAASTTDESFSMSCSCGSTVCRGVITGSDWRTADITSMYRGHVVPAVRAASLLR